jgi:hypothetical protein
MNLESSLNSAIFDIPIDFWREKNSSVILALFANLKNRTFLHARIKNLFCKHHLCLHASLPLCQVPIYSCVLISLRACLLVSSCEDCWKIVMVHQLAGRKKENDDACHSWTTAFEPGPTSPGHGTGTKKQCRCNRKNPTRYINFNISFCLPW